MAASELYLQLDSQSYSESAPVYQILNDLEGGPVSRGRRSFTHNQAELGVKTSRWLFAALTRYDYFLEYHPDTAEIIYRDANNIPLGRDRDYRIDIAAIHAYSRGVKVGYQFIATERLQLGLAFSWLTSDQLLDGSIKGSATVDSDDYLGSARIDYVYDEPIFLDRAFGEPDGDGYSVDFDLYWQLREDLSVRVWLKDAFSEVVYDNASFTVADIDTNRIAFDDQGLIETKPLLSGFRGGRKHVLKYPKRTSVYLQKQLTDTLSGAVSWEKYDDVDFYSLESQYQWRNDWVFKLGFEAQSEALEIGVQHRLFTFALAADQFDWREAHYLRLRLGLRLQI